MSLDTSTPQPTRTHSLNDVRAIVPEACYKRSAGRAAWALARAWTVYLLPVAALAVVHTAWLVPILWVLAGLGAAGLFVLGHDASHGALLNSRKASRIVAQFCMGPSLHVESAWDLGHNRIHHGYTTREGFDFVWHPLTADQYAGLGRLARLRHRLEWSWLGSGAYYLREVWWSKMWRFNAPGKRHDAIVRDKIVLGSVVGVIVAATVVLGALTGGWTRAIWLPLSMWVIPFLIFTHIIGWTVYVHHVDPDIRWWTRKEWTQYKGQMESTTILRTIPVVNWLWFHNIFVHVPHHVDVRIPFHQLPAAAEAIAEHYPDTVRRSRLSIRNYLHATKACKLYDFEAGRWSTYSSATAN